MINTYPSIAEKLKGTVTMERWIGKTAVVTGGSSGIGAVVCVALANHGLHVVALARRVHLVEKLKALVKGKGKIHAKQCDIAKREELSATFEWIDDMFGPVHVMVNNAGVMYLGHITDIADGGQLSDEQIQSVMDTNTMATILCTRLAIKSMKKHFFDGHIVNINSISGHYIPLASYFNVYPCSKHAVTAFLESLNNELAHLRSGIKVTSLSPGSVDTPMALDEEHELILAPRDVADALLYVLSTPPSVNITELTIRPVAEKRL
ncbi:hypothetical protein ACJJTC_006086 [Scirpophaga incertulas]